MTASDRDSRPDHDDEEDLLPVDKDIALITDYLARALSPEDRAEVERRLIEDIPFFNKVWPIIRIWQLPEAKRRRRARAQARAEADAPTTAPPRSERPYGDVPPPPRRVRESTPLYVVKRASAWARRHPIMTVAALFLLFFGRPFGQELAYGAVVATAQDLAKQNVQASNPNVGTYVETGHGETRTITLPGGSIVTLSPQSRFTYRTLDRWFMHGVIATLKGEAQIEVSDADGMMFLGTVGGGAAFLPGNYAARCELGCETLKVTVGLIGTVWIKGTTATQWTFWPLHSRQHGEVTPFHDPKDTDGGPEYPVVP